MRIFLSAVSGEFRKCRKALASDLRAAGDTVIEQTDFPQHGRTLLEKLEKAIAGCDRVIAIVGAGYGFELTEEARPAGRPRRSYTQWEYHFAQGERLDGTRTDRKDIFVYFANERYLRKHPFNQAGDEADLQRRHVAEIKASGEDYNEFGSLLELWRHLFRAGFHVRDPDHRPNNLPFRSIGTLFKGRDDFLEQVGGQLRGGTGKAAAIVATQAIHGLGGVGKTRAAVEYAWKHVGDYAALLFVSAPTAGELRARLADLVGVLAVEDAPTDIETRLELVLRWLDDHPGWLLILDNVDSPEAAAEVQAMLGRLRAGHVVITSRIGNWRAGVEPLELHVLDEESAVGFLLERATHRRRTADKADQAAAVARDLDGLALALEQAAAYIDTLHLSVAEYRQRWEARRAEVLEWYDPQAMEYPRNVAQTWLTTFEQLDEPERRMLGVLSWLAPEPIPLALFETEPMVDDFGDARATLAGLARFSLVRFDEDGESVTVHRLVQEIGRGRIREEDRVPTLKLALDAVNALAVGNSMDVRTWNVWTPMAPHNESVAHHADSYGLTDSTSRLMDQTGRYWQARGQYPAAEPLMRRALAIDERSLGADHPNVAIDLNNLASLLQATNRLGEAEPLMRRCVEIRRRFRETTGFEHPSWRLNLGNYRGLLEAMGLPEEEIARRVGEAAGME